MQCPKDPPRVSLVFDIGQHAKWVLPSNVLCTNGIAKFNASFSNFSGFVVSNGKSLHQQMWSLYHSLCSLSGSYRAGRVVGGVPPVDSHVQLYKVNRDHEQRLGKATGQHVKYSQLWF
jgi:hypothetical protein